MQGWNELSINTDIKLYYLSIKLMIIVKQQQKGRLSFCLFVLKSDSVSSCVNALCTDLEFLPRATNNPKLFSSSHGWMLQGDVCVCACLCVCACVRACVCPPPHPFTFSPAGKQCGETGSRMGWEMALILDICVASNPVYLEEERRVALETYSRGLEFALLFWGPA